MRAVACRWVCVYPVYLDRQRSIEEGRKVAKETAIENPTAREMAFACQKLKLHCVIEVRRFCFFPLCFAALLNGKMARCAMAGSQAAPARLFHVWAHSRAAV